MGPIESVAQVQQKHLTQVAAAEWLKVSDRQARRMLRRMLLRLRQRGDRCWVTR